MYQPQNLSRSDFLQTRDNVEFLVNSPKDSIIKKSNLIAIPFMPRPNGGGAIEEKSSPNAVNGKSPLTIPIPFSPERNGQIPQLTLSYNFGGDLIRNYSQIVELHNNSLLENLSIKYWSNWD